MPAGFGPNCALGICCPPKSPAARRALANEICAGLNWATAEQEQAAKDVAEWIQDNYDLAPHGSLTNLFAEIATLARENP